MDLVPESRFVALNQSCFPRFRELMFRQRAIGHRALVWYQFNLTTASSPTIYFLISPPVTSPTQDSYLFNCLHPRLLTFNVRPRCSPGSLSSTRGILFCLKLTPLFISYPWNLNYLAPESLTANFLSASPPAQIFVVPPCSHFMFTQHP